MRSGIAFDPLNGGEIFRKGRVLFGMMSLSSHEGRLSLIRRVIYGEVIDFRAVTSESNGMVTWSI